MFEGSRAALILSACLIAAVACGGGGGSDTPADVVTDAASDAQADVPIVPPGIVRFVHISDLHVHGEWPQTSAAHLKAAIDLLNGVDFDADFLMATGDYVDYIPDGSDPADPGAYSRAMELLDGSKWPWRACAGNHEYYSNEQLSPTSDKAARDSYLEEATDGPLDYAFMVDGVRFVVLNSMAGDRWEDNAGLIGSFTDEQLQWIRGELSDGRPTIVFMHHPPTAGALTPTGDSLCDALGDGAANVKAVFAGHLHGFWKGDACGVPYYLVGNTDPEKPFYYLVEYDGAADVLTIVNEKDLPFGKFPEFECDPAEPGTVDPSGMVGSVQVVRGGSMVSNLPGLEGFDGDGLDSVPPVIRIDGSLPDGADGSKRFSGRFTMGMDDAGFVAYVDASPCASFELNVDGACVVTSDVQMGINIIPVLSSVLGVSLDPSWAVNIDVKSLVLEGRVGDGGGVPVIEDGLIHLAGSGAAAVTDVKSILVSEYCASNIPGCDPGASADMPACPADPEPGFFDGVPAQCDVEIGGFPLRFLLTFVQSYPLDNINIVGAFRTEARDVSAVPGDGLVDEKLFSGAPGMNCSGVSGR